MKPVVAGHDRHPSSMKTRTATILICGLMMIHAQAQGLQPGATNTPPQPALVLPLDRTVYFVGETVPLAVRGASPGKVELVDERGTVAAVGDGPGTAWRIPTASLAPGAYQVRRNGEGVPAFSLVSPLRQSPGVLFDEVPPSVPGRIGVVFGKQLHWNCHRG